MLIAASFISLNISPKSKSACALVTNNAATATRSCDHFFHVKPFYFDKYNLIVSVIILNIS